LSPRGAPLPGAAPVVAESFPLVCPPRPSPRGTRRAGRPPGLLWPPSSPAPRRAHPRAASRPPRARAAAAAAAARAARQRQRQRHAPAPPPVPLGRRRWAGRGAARDRAGADARGGGGVGSSCKDVRLLLLLSGARSLINFRGSYLPRRTALCKSKQSL